MVRPENLPEYDRPPVDEVVVGIYFEPLKGFTDVLPISLRDLLRPDGYESFDIQPPLVLDDPEPTAPMKREPSASLPLSLLQGPVPKRFWFGTPDDVWIVQLQHDLLLVNWRRRGEAEYPRFVEVGPRFQVAQQALLKALDSGRLPGSRVRQVEVLYVNWITDLSLATWFRPAEAAILTGSRVAHEPEVSAWSAFHGITDAEGAALGRLKIECQSAARLDGAHWVDGTQLSLRARLAVQDLALTDDVMGFFDDGRNAIVQAFTDLTTTRAHTHWGRTK